MDIEHPEPPPTRRHGLRAVRRATTWLAVGTATATIGLAGAAALSTPEGGSTSVPPSGTASQPTAANPASRANTRNRDDDDHEHDDHDDHEHADHENEDHEDHDDERQGSEEVVTPTLTPTAPPAPAGGHRPVVTSGGS